MKQFRHPIPGIFLLAGVLLASSVAAAQQPSVNSAYLKDHYTKSEVMIPMRDGMQLFTAIYTPTDSTEPTNLRIARGQRGRMEIRATTSGVSCHGSAPERGVNAAYKLAPACKAIE